MSAKTIRDWLNAGYFVPSGRHSDRSGRHHLWTDRDVLVVRVVGRLRAMGAIDFVLRRAAVVVSNMREDQVALLSLDDCTVVHDSAVAKALPAHLAEHGQTWIVSL